MTTLGFTLIELLAVIVILAVIALIATPLIMGVIDEAKDGANKRSVQNIRDGAETFLLSKKTLDSNYTFNMSEYTFKGNQFGKVTEDERINIVFNDKDEASVAVYENNKCYYILAGSNEVESETGLDKQQCLEKAGKIEYVDNSGANRPKLLNNMVAIKYDGNKWVVADTSEEWYNYNFKEWANAVVLKEPVSAGEEVTEENIDLWLVWIPRYKYQLFNANNGSVNEQEIQIEFESGISTTGTVSCIDNISGSGDTSETCTNAVNGNWYTHPAFTFGDEELTGFWVGKFEISGTVDKITTIPNVSSLREQTVSSFFNNILKVKDTYSLNGDSHMIKNMEWGAIAYLSHSKYGTCTDGICTEVSINDNSNYYTGGGQSDAYKTNFNQSTTGNIYGIYDMRGGSYEYTMGNMVNSSGIFYSSNAGFETNNEPEEKYYDKYTYGTSYTQHNRGRLGDATRETLKAYGITTGGWYGDYAVFVSSSYSWFVRGGIYSSAPTAGIFYFNYYDGRVDPYISSRLVVVSSYD